jgi:glucose-1-phosphatase
LALKHNSVKNLIFDLGGVILDLSVDHTLAFFTTLSGLDKQHVTEIFKTSPEFNEYEKGKINDHQFRDFIRKTYCGHASDQEIDLAWNAMLRGIPKTKLDLLLKLKKKYQVFLLSNTNGIHLNYINQVLLPQVTGGYNLDEYFHIAYYSHRMLKRKPDAEIFEHVITENNLLAAESLFLDDNLSNVEGAKAVGLQTVYVSHPDLILDYFHE